MGSETPRALTTEEMRDIFFKQINSILEYWATTDLNRPEFKNEIDRKGEMRYRMEGLVFSILVMFDGGSMGIPALDITPSPHDSDQAFHKNEGSNWWSPVVINECQLHETWSKMT